MTRFKPLTIEQLAQQFKLNSEEHFTGELQIQSAASLRDPAIMQTTWSLYFLLGRLVWANSNGHRFRRWRRAFLTHKSDLFSDVLLAPNQCVDPFWEYRLLTALVRNAKIQRHEAIAIIEYLLGEVIFDIFQAGASYQQNSDASDTIKQLGEPVTILHPKHLLVASHKRWKAWCDAELTNFSPHLAPYINQDQELRNRISAKSYNLLIDLVDGQSPLADIATHMHQDVLRFTKFLLPLLRKGLLALRSVPDLVPEVGLSDQNPALSKDVKAPKILCIDDNPNISWQLEQILTKAGYGCVSTQDPLRAIPLLLEQKPHLVFLDLVMPIASGYEICSQIRRISAFKNIPVIILTGNDGIVDRVRAKVVGASDFMAKPVNPVKVMEIVRRYCPLNLAETTLARETLQSG